MLSSPEDFCKFIGSTLAAQRHVFPKNKVQTVLVPWAYIQGIIDSKGFTAFQADVDAWIAANPGAMSGGAVTIQFNVASNGDMQVDATYAQEAPVVLWPFDLGANLVLRLARLHVAAAPADGKVSLSVPRASVGSHVDVFKLQATLATELPTIKDLVVSVDAEFIRVSGTLQTLK